MENSLKFLQTYTVEQFKSAQNVSKIEVKQNPHTSKLFFTFGAETGAVSAKGVPTHPMISRVEKPNGEQIYLLHEEGNGGAPVIATF